MPPRLRTAERYYRFSARLAERAAREVARKPSLRTAAVAIATYQAAQAAEVQASTSAMLLEQGANVVPEATLVPLAFTTPVDAIEAMLRDIQQQIEAEIEIEAEKLLQTWQAERLTESLVQDAGRAAQQVDVAARPDVRFVRHLNLPSCGRCAVLAGRVYRYSQGFQRHPGCDCVMLPVTVANPDLTYDPAELARTGQVSGLSKADMKAIEHGADLGQVVNVRSRKAGLTVAGRVLDRAGRPTPEAILQAAGDDRDKALDLLRQHGYIR